MDVGLYRGWAHIMKGPGPYRLDHEKHLQQGVTIHLV